LPATLAGVSEVAPAGVVLTGIKKCEDAEALLLRLLNTTGRSANARVKLNPDLLGPVTDAAEVDLLERCLDGGATAGGNTVKVKIPARAVASVKVSLGDKT
ncbi:MAG: glycosyl hydrolase-related protein, partial [Phycisphaerae bacterium]